MKRFARSVLLLIITVALLAMAGCGDKKDADQTKEAKVLNIGYSGPLSGGAAYYGKDTLSGLELAVEQINAAGGLTVAGEKYVVKLISLDDRYLPNETATNAHRLVKEYNTPIIFCPHSGGIAAMQEFNQTENFLIGGYSSEPKLYEQGNKLTLLIPPPYDCYIEPYSKRAMEKFGKKVAMIQGNHAYGKDWGEKFEPLWESMGGTVTIKSPFSYNTETDFSTYVSKALATKPDVLFVGGASQPTAMVIKQARDQGFKGGFIVLDQAKIEDMADVVSMSALEGAIGVYPLYQYPNADQDALKKFVDSYTAKYSKRPTWEQGWHFESMWVLAKAIEKAGTTTDPAKIFSSIGQVLPIDKNIAPIGIKGITPKGGWNSPGNGVMVIDGKLGEFFECPRISG
jgi:branched-chain amino acid transport system substrate-binding protein